MSNPKQPQNNPSLRRTLNTGFKAQSSIYDQMWYAINFSSYFQGRSRQRKSPLLKLTSEGAFFFRLKIR